MIVVRLQPHSSVYASAPRAYRIAGQILLCDVPISQLEPYSTDENHPWPVPLVQPERHAPPSARLIRRAEGHLPGLEPAAVCWSEGSAYRVRIEGAGEFSVDPASGLIAPIGFEERAGSTGDLARLALGIPLHLALATKGIFCLHASTVAAIDGVIAFIGASGAGKSTLASFLVESSFSRWRRISDEALPVTRGADGPVALPHFPQMSLAPSEQVGGNAAERLPLRAIYLLSVPSDSLQAAVHRMSGRAAAAALIFHTLAAGLFDEALLQQHMAFCAGVAASIPVRELIYPHTREALQTVDEVLASDLGL